MLVFLNLDILINPQQDVAQHEDHAMPDQDLETTLATQFYGSQTFLKWSSLYPSCLLTEGTMYLAEEADAYWLFDAIQSHIAHSFSDKNFLASTLTTDEETASAVLVITDGNDNELVTQNITFTDFPLSTITVWSERNELGGHTHLLPREH